MKQYDKYISTTLPYANSHAHMGHALEFIQADALVMYFTELKNEKVFFNIGIDEHGLKVYTKANELGIETQAYLDELCLKWKSFCESFEISYDSFYRTSDPKHAKKVKEFWFQCLERGDLYKKKYVGKYCAGCESFKADSDLIDGKCTDHGTEPVITEEENWFFKVSKYKALTYGWLMHETTTSSFLHPTRLLTELENVILSAEDISVSRLKKNVPWGIQVPNDEDQVIYVWFEALLNYVFAVDDFRSQHFIQLCGPDNIRFQGSLFQMMLQSAGLPHTKKLIVHGTILDKDGKKMSKSLGNVVDPMDQLSKYGLDAVRYYTLSNVFTYRNAGWSEQELIDRYNSDLADGFGNLITRTLHLIDTKNVTVTEPDEQHKIRVDQLVASAHQCWETFNVYSAIKETNLLIADGNRYINEERPWEEGKDRARILSNLHYTITKATKLYVPILSHDTIARLCKALDDNKKVIIFKKIESIKSII